MYTLTINIEDYTVIIKFVQFCVHMISTHFNNIDASCIHSCLIQSERFCYKIALCSIMQYVHISYTHVDLFYYSSVCNLSYQPPLTVDYRLSHAYYRYVGSTCECCKNLCFHWWHDLHLVSSHFPTTRHTGMYKNCWLRVSWYPHVRAGILFATKYTYPLSYVEVYNSQTHFPWKHHIYYGT